MKRLRVGVVGCGKIAQMIHLPILADGARFQLSALCDVSAEVVEGVGDRFGVKERYTEYRDLVQSSSVDTVAVLTRDHVDVALAAADSGKHVFIEKPLCYSPAGAAKLVSASRTPGIKMMVGYMKLFDPGFEHGRKLVHAWPTWSYARLHNFAGDRTVYQGLYRFDLPGGQPAQIPDEATRAEILGAIGAERQNYADLYEMVLNVGSHDFAVLRAALGAPNGVLYSTLSGNKLIVVLDYGVRRCTFELGADSTYPGWDESLTVYGGNDSVTIDFANPFIRYTPTIVRTTTQEGRAAIASEARLGHQEAFARQWEHFHDCILEGSTVRSSVEGGRTDVDLATEILARLDV